MINSYALSKARYLVDKCGSKEILITNELFVKQCNEIKIFKTLPDLRDILTARIAPAPVVPLVCIAWALVEKDIVDEKPIKTSEEYFRLIFTHEDAARRIQFFYYNLNENKYDDGLEEQDKKIILENSITLFEKKFSSLKVDEHYKKYQELLKAEEEKVNKKNSVVDWIVYDSIIGGLKNNINYKNESLGISNKTTLESILGGLKKIKMNFYIEYEADFKIYPLIVDMLGDLFLLEYFFHYKKSRTRPLTSATVWPDIVEEYGEGGKSYTYLFFSQLVRIEEIGSRNIRPYFLAEYARILNVDKEELRLLMQNTFFPIPEDHRGSFGLKFNIENIAPTQFLLEETKMVIGGL